MPNARKKKQAKNEDFKKKKLKIGKKKALPDNFTDTSFRSKTISLPNQSITEDKSKQVTTRKNLTLTDLITQLKHYSPGVRKDAVLGLHELCSSHPGTLGASLGTVVNGILKLFVDDDREVRKVLLSFLEEAMPDVDDVNLAPFLPLLVMYTCSAMSHIFEDIRLDAVKLMDLWVKLSPETVVDRFWNKIIGIYTSLLMVNNINTSHTSTGTKITNIGSAKAAAAKSHLHLYKSKLGLLGSLEKLLDAGLSKNRREYMWFLLGSLDSKRAKESFKNQLARLKSSRQSNVVNCTAFSPKVPISCYLPHPATNSSIPYIAHLNSLTLNLFESAGPKNQGVNKSLSNTGNTESFKKSSGVDDFNVQKLIEMFQPVLLSTWLETAPSVFSSTNSITLTPALELLHVILKITVILWRALVSGDEMNQVDAGWLEQHCYQLLKHFSAYFPYGADALGDGGAKVDAVLRDMNITACELTSLLLLAKTAYIHHQQQSAEVTGRKRRRQHNEMENINTEWAEKIVDHVLGILGSQDSRNSKITAMSANLKETDLDHLLPAIWGFMNSLSPDHQFEIFQTFVNYYHRCNVTSSLKRVALEFLSSVYLIQSNPSYNGRFHLDTPEYSNIVQGWFHTLPKTLWQLKTNHIETSRFILNIMCEISKQGTKNIFDKETLLKTELAMVPFFHVNLTTKGSLFGPFIKLPKDIQDRALEFLYYVNSGSEKLEKAVSECKNQQIISA